MEPNNSKDRQNRQQRSDQEIFDAITEFEKSNLSVKEFCELYDISDSTFYTWKQKAQRITRPKGSFVPVVTLTEEPLTAVHAELSLPGGMVFRFLQPVDASFVKSLIA